MGKLTVVSVAIPMEEEPIADGLAKLAAGDGAAKADYSRGEDGYDLDTSPEYKAAHKKFIEAAEAYDKVVRAYRARKIGDKEFVEATRVYRAAEKEFDFAEAREQGRTGKVAKATDLVEIDVDGRPAQLVGNRINFPRGGVIAAVSRYMAHMGGSIVNNWVEFDSEEEAMRAWEQLAERTQKVAKEEAPVEEGAEQPTGEATVTTDDGLAAYDLEGQKKPEEEGLKAAGATGLRKASSRWARALEAFLDKWGHWADNGIGNIDSDEDTSLSNALSNIKNGLARPGAGYGLTSQELNGLLGQLRRIASNKEYPLKLQDAARKLFVMDVDFDTQGDGDIEDAAKPDGLRKASDAIYTQDDDGNSFLTIGGRKQDVSGWDAGKFRRALSGVKQVKITGIEGGGYGGFPVNGTYPVETFLEDIEQLSAASDEMGKASTDGLRKGFGDADALVSLARDFQSEIGSSNARALQQAVQRPSAQTIQAAYKALQGLARSQHEGVPDLAMQAMEILRSRGEQYNLYLAASAETRKADDIQTVFAWLEKESKRLRPGQLTPRLISGGRLIEVTFSNGSTTTVESMSEAQAALKESQRSGYAASASAETRKAEGPRLSDLLDEAIRTKDWEAVRQAAKTARKAGDRFTAQELEFAAQDQNWYQVDAISNNLGREGKAANTEELAKADFEVLGEYIIKIGTGLADVADECGALSQDAKRGGAGDLAEAAKTWQQRALALRSEVKGFRPAGLKASSDNMDKAADARVKKAALAVGQRVQALDGNDKEGWWLIQGKVEAINGDVITISGTAKGLSGQAYGRNDTGSWDFRVGDQEVDQRWVQNKAKQIAAEGRRQVRENDRRAREGLIQDAAGATMRKADVGALERLKSAILDQDGEAVRRLAEEMEKEASGGDKRTLRSIARLAKEVAEPGMAEELTSLASQLERGFRRAASATTHKVRVAEYYKQLYPMAVEILEGMMPKLPAPIGRAIRNATNEATLVSALNSAGKYLRSVVEESPSAPERELLDDLQEVRDEANLDLQLAESSGGLRKAPYEYWRNLYPLAVEILEEMFDKIPSNLERGIRVAKDEWALVRALNEVGKYVSDKIDDGDHSLESLMDDLHDVASEANLPLQLAALTAGLRKASAPPRPLTFHDQGFDVEAGTFHVQPTAEGYEAFYKSADGTETPLDEGLARQPYRTAGAAQRDILARWGQKARVATLLKVDKAAKAGLAKASKLNFKVRQGKSRDGVPYEEHTAIDQEAKFEGTYLVYDSDNLPPDKKVRAFGSIRGRDFGSEYFRDASAAERYLQEMYAKAGEARQPLYND